MKTKPQKPSSLERNVQRQRPMSTTRLLLKLASVTIDLKRLVNSLDALARDLVEADKNGITNSRQKPPND